MSLEPNIAAIGAGSSDAATLLGLDRLAGRTPADEGAAFEARLRARRATEVSMPSSVFALRFQIYCLESKFLSPEDHPGGLERDEHDAASAHFCELDSTQEPVGYVRLVLPDGADRFPFQQHCDRLDPGVRLPDPGESAEISRLMVHSMYRRRRTDSLPGLVTDTDPAPLTGERRSNSPQVLLSLYRQMYAFSVAHGIRYWYAAMERTLARSLRQLQFNFRRLGPEVDYFGPVAPYVADLRELEKQLATAHPALFAWLTRPVAPFQ